MYQQPQVGYHQNEAVSPPPSSPAPPPTYAAPYVQQTSMNTVNVITTQPQPQVTNDLMLVPLHGHRTWTTGLCGCFEDILSCCCTCFCMSCMECSNANRIGECCCVPYCVPGGSIAVRTRIRTIGGIQGSICNDCITLFCCTCCAVCQMSRELDHMGII